MLKEWDNLPEFLKIPEVKPYYDILDKRRGSLILKRIFDVILASIMLLILIFPMLLIAIIIKIESPGPVFFRQERVTIYGKIFRIHKFRTMVNNADKIGADITTYRDTRITKVGSLIRKIRFDEFPQILDVLSGNMAFVGTRPELIKYVRQYTPEMRATLLMPAGITSEASIRYKDEDKYLNDAENIETMYIRKVLPEKMKLNLKSIQDFSLSNEILTIFRTVRVVFGKKS